MCKLQKELFHSSFSRLSCVLYSWRARSQVRRKFAARSWVGALKGTHGERGAPFWECRSSPEAVAPINQETSATSATPYCEHRRHVQKLLSPASFRFSRPTFSSASRRRHRQQFFHLFLVFQQYSLSVFAPHFLVSVYPPCARTEDVRPFCSRTEANIIASTLGRLFSSPCQGGNEINGRSADSFE